MTNQNENTTTHTKNEKEEAAAESNVMLTCSLCGKKLFSNESSDILIEEIAGSQYHFDNPQCLVMFKRLNHAYGKNLKNFMGILNLFLIHFGIKQFLQRKKLMKLIKNHTSLISG